MNINGSIFFFINEINATIIAITSSVYLGNRWSHKTSKFRIIFHQSYPKIHFQLLVDFNLSIHF